MRRGVGARTVPTEIRRLHQAVVLVFFCSLLAIDAVVLCVGVWVRNVTYKRVLLLTEANDGGKGGRTELKGGGSKRRTRPTRGLPSLPSPLPAPS